MGARKIARDVGRGRLFGTDGIRGIANRDLTGDLAFRLGRAAVLVLTEHGESRPHITVGRDTRASGEFLEAALTAGICSAGGDVVLLGVCPTPAVAFLTTDLGAHAGVVISASHNPSEYNGIKFFGAAGYKLPDELEDEMESAVESNSGPKPTGRGVGRIVSEPHASDRYLDHLAEDADGSLEGMRVVMDCANGAASEVGPQLLVRLGAAVVPINDEPDGWNINDGCGATVPEVVALAAVEEDADAGVALDGDADRALFADSGGRVIDGDQVLAACALAMQGAGQLAGDTVVTTVMANLGFRLSMRDAGIGVVEARVGDRYVLEEMVRTGASLGGEQSGHVIFLRDATTGDGLLTAVHFLTLARRRGVTVDELATVMRRFPQVLVNVRVDAPGDVEGNQAVGEAVARAEAAMARRGRVLVRPSGTEPVVRVMVEAETQEEAEAHAEAISAAVRKALR
jgi:phosphoglucosamine mutase